MVEKILARHAGIHDAKPGDIVVCEVDMAVQIDLSILVDDRLALPRRIADPDRVALIMDHRVPASKIDDAAAHRKARQFAATHGIRRFFDVGRSGICHQVIQESGLALPGQILVCSDSHTIASGVLNCAARGLGQIEITQIMCTGKTWFRVSPTILFRLEGRKPANVFGKDILLHIAGRYGSVEGHSVEFSGPGLRTLPLDDRSTICTMCAEISADFATMPADEVVLAYLASRTQAAFESAVADDDAEYAAIHVVNLEAVRPTLARPDFIPNNTLPLEAFGERVRIDQAFVGSCANGKLEDLKTVAAVLKGRRIAPGVRLIVTPASQKIYLEALRAGYVETIVETGALVTNSTCGACAGGHMGVVGPGEVCITSSTRNFRGRMGSPDARIYMASSATVAASAVLGYIADPTPFLVEAGVA
ncbi:MAG: 3-isopropylmalate dehydratase large subunit [Burkholderiales bacterium]|nr:3-isopropylmalate dehydratase large subunit [Burkholderiales bacterium]